MILYATFMLLTTTAITAKAQYLNKLFCKPLLLIMHNSPAVMARAKLQCGGLQLQSGEREL